MYSVVILRHHYRAGRFEQDVFVPGALEIRTISLVPALTSLLVCRRD